MLLLCLNAYMLMFCDYYFIIFRSQNNLNWQSVADRISELERQHLTSSHNGKYSYLDPSKTHRVSNPTLKAFQKNAVQSYFARQQSFKESGNSINNNQTRNSNSNSSIRYSPRPQSLQLNTTKNNNNIRSSLPETLLRQTSYQKQHTMCNTSSSNLSNNNYNNNEFSNSKHLRNSMKKGTVPQCDQTDNINIYAHTYSCENTAPPPPPRNRSSLPARRTSSASEYASSREQVNLKSKQNLSKDLLRPMIIGPIISVDDWVPERPPKNPMLRVPSPELPPPPPLNSVEANSQLDEPLPPPPPELLKHVRQLSEPETKPLTSCRRNSFAGQTNMTAVCRSSASENLKPPTLTSRIPPNSLPAFPPKPVLNPSVKSNPEPVKQQKTINHPFHSIQQSPNRLVDSRLSIRKRSHNSQNIIELTAPIKGVVTSPPPLKPKMSVFSGEFKFYNNNGVSR